MCFETVQSIGNVDSRNSKAAHYKLIKSLSKVPMILCCLTTGFLSGVNQACFKFVGLALLAGTPLVSFFILGLAIMGGIGAATQLTLVNIAIKFYRQVDVSPAYTSLITIMTVVAGLTIFDESKYYSWSRLLGLFFSISVSCIGIFLLAVKENFQEEEKKDKSDQRESARISEQM